MNDDSINKEDEKEVPQFKIPKKEEINLGFYMLDKILNDDDFVNMSGTIAKNINIEQFMSNITNDPLLNDFISIPNDDKFKDKNNNIDLKAITKYNYEKMGFSENDQYDLVENCMKIINNPKIKKISKDIIENNNNPNDKYHK